MDINPIRGNYQKIESRSPEYERVIFTGDKAEIEKLLTKLSVGKIVEDLGNGFYLAQVKKGASPEIFKALPDNLKAFMDEKVQLIRPEEEKEVLKKRKLEELKREGEQKPPSLPETNVTLDITQANKVHEMGIKGQNVVVAVIDTGIGKHDDFGNRLTYFYDATKGEITEPRDGHGHGTHVASIAAGDGRFTGLAPAAEIWGIKVLGDDGSGYTSDIIRGINQVVEKAKAEGKKVVANMSLGGYAFKPWNQDPLALAVEKAIKDGVYFAIAAGNSGPYPNTVGTPAIAPNAVTVAAYDDKKTTDLSDDDIARFSSRGPVKNAPDETSKLKPDVSMPGVKIWAANVPGSELDQLASQGKIPRTADGKYIAISGTSMATPGVAGAMALILSANPNLTEAQVKELLMKHTIKLEKTDPTDNKPYDQFDQGAGLVNVYEAVKEALSMLPQPTQPEPNPQPNPQEPSPKK